MIEQQSLGSLCEITSSKRIFAEEYVSEGIPFYRSKEIIERNNNHAISEPLYILPSRFEEIKKKFGVPISGDVLLTSVGTLGIPYRVKDTDLFYFKDGNLIWMRRFSDRLDSQYLYYWFSSKFGKQSLIQKAIGSSQAALTIEILKNYKLPVPSLATQQKLASILSAYDSQIENNQKRIKLLEQMAENLYKEWFVRFRFPGYENAEFDGGIPKGWNIEKLSSVASVTYGFPFNSSLFCADNTLNPVVRIRDIANKHTDTYTPEKPSDKYIIHANDILIGMDGIFHMNIWTNEGDYLNQRVVRVASKECNLSNLFIYYSIYPQVKMLESIISGTTVAHLSAKDMNKMTVLVPDKKVLELSSSRFKNILSMRKSLLVQNDLLTTQRDLLLPRLMSGKINF